MKTSSKAILIGVISFVVFLIGNAFLGSIVGAIISSGDDFANSYFYPLYTAITVLISLVISFTYLIFKKSICYWRKWEISKFQYVEQLDKLE